MNHTVRYAFFVLMLPLLTSGAFIYNDQKQNCTKSVKGNFCYDGPKFDDQGQYKSCAIPGTIALTFDDGPTVATPYILDVLKAYGMKATFFLIGANVFKYPEMVDRMLNEGHQVASHTFTHPWVGEVTNDEFRQELELFENAFMQRIFAGVSSFTIPTYFRSPHGNLDSSKKAILIEYGYLPIHWSFLNGDSYIDNPEEILTLWKSHFGPSTNYSKLSIIVQQHEREQATNASFAVVTAWLNATFVSQGIRFVTVADCLDNVVLPYRPSPRRYEDPSCTNGIKFLSTTYGNVCCAASCGACGGNGCGTRQGGCHGCCVNQIVKNNISCAYSSPGCNL